jgi:outer membrane protein OmpA-like peptidoglycan-associated protein
MFSSASVALILTFGLANAVQLGASRGVCIGTKEACSARETLQALVSLGLSVNFELDSADLSPDAQAKLAGFARALQDYHPGHAAFVIQGFADASGPAAHNDALSARRARAVADFLASLGIERSRIRAEGMRETRPVAIDPFDPANRRVEIRIELSDERPF